MINPAYSHGFNGTTQVDIQIPEGEQAIERDLTAKPVALGYRPTAAVHFQDSGYYGELWLQAVLRDIERMLVHPDVAMPYLRYKSGVASTKFEIEASSSEVEEFAGDTLERMWERSLEQYQHCYDYGWGGYEVAYAVENSLLQYQGVFDFHPWDVWAVTRANVYRGLYVAGTNRGDASASLYGPGKHPAKGLWLTHNRRYHRFYGRSQLLAAWKPWRRLAYPDSAEEVVDGGIYRFAYRGPIVRYPPRDFKKRGTGETDYDAARNVARQFSEEAKAGVSTAFPNTRDDQGNYEWDLDWPEHTINVDGLLNYVDYLKREISAGIGVPPELIEASEVGSGWSGRAIPLIGFHNEQMRNARDLVSQLEKQIVSPLARWNFGPDAWFRVKVSIGMPEDLIPDQAQGEAAAAGGGEGGENPLAALAGGGDEQNPQLEMSTENDTEEAEVFTEADSLRMLYDVFHEDYEPTEEEWKKLEGFTLSLESGELEELVTEFGLKEWAAENERAIYDYVG